MPPVKPTALDVAIAEWACGLAPKNDCNACRPLKSNVKSPATAIRECCRKGIIEELLHYQRIDHMTDFDVECCTKALELLPGLPEAAGPIVLAPPSDIDDQEVH